MTDTAALKQRLVRLEARYDALVAGSVPQQLGTERNSVHYGTADLDRLQRLIADLRRQIAQAEGRRPASGGGYVRVV